MTECLCLARFELTQISVENIYKRVSVCLFLTFFTCPLFDTQANNAYIFPGFGLGLIMSGAIRVHDDMLLAACKYKYAE